MLWKTIFRGWSWTIIFISLVLGGLKVGEAQFIPPSIPCLSSLVSVSVPTTTPYWAWVFLGNNIKPPKGMWEYVWDWSFIYDCSVGPFSACQICSRVEVDYYSTTTNQWVVVDQGIVNSPSSSAGCWTQVTVDMHTVWGSLSPAGTLMQATWQIAEFRPNISSDCFGQDYQDVVVQTWTIPPDAASRP